MKCRVVSCLLFCCYAAVAQTPVTNDTIERRNKGQFYLQQFAQTIAALPGMTFTGQPVEQVLPR